MYHDYDYWWESLAEEDAYWNSITENEKLYELELKPEVDIASYELEQYAYSRCRTKERKINEQTSIWCWSQ